ncbi:MAG: type VI secretion system tube protein Hcp [Acidobacteriota bacterium]|nr:MAG: type VI secretion system tube protein Hcp [Acidobacteriota bacterium]
MPIYLKFEGIQGNGKGRYKGWIEIDSAQLGYAGPRPPLLKNKPGGSVVSEITITKIADSTTPQMLRHLHNNEGRKVKIHFVKSDGPKEAPYISIELENTLISSYSIVNQPGGKANYYETIALNYTKITYNTSPISTPKDPADVEVKAQWDLKK